MVDVPGWENQSVSDWVFGLASMSTRTGKTGKPYLAVVLADRTGNLDARMWEGFEELATRCSAGCYVRVTGRVEMYQGKAQLVLAGMDAVPTNDVDRRDFLPVSEFSTESMAARLREHVNGFDNGQLRALVTSFLDDPAIGPRFVEWPAAKRLHHAHLGGLLEHVLGLLRVARAVVALPPYKEMVERDLLFAGIILHDLGKVLELSADPGFEYTLRGQLVGHIAIMQGMLHAKVAELDAAARARAEAEGGEAEVFPPRLLLLLEHLLLSHHGKLEFGSPKLPMTPEALLMSTLDDLEAKFDTMRSEFGRARRAEAPVGQVTDWVRSMDRPLFDSRAYLAQQELQAVPTTRQALAEPPDHPPMDATRQPEPAEQAGENTEMKAQPTA